jgi:hypothetical protein
MRTAKITKILFFLVGFAVFATLRCYGQAEVDPDHFDSPSDVARTEKARFDGKVTIPYSVTCNGKRLQPGRYMVSLRSDGKTGRVTLNQNGQTIEIAGAVWPPAASHAGNSVLVECIGKAHRLAAIHVAEMELVFDSGPQVEQTFDGKQRRTEKLLLTRASPQK